MYMKISGQTFKKVNIKKICSQILSVENVYLEGFGETYIIFHVVKILSY